MKYLVTLNTPADLTTLHELGCDIIAEYPDSVLIRCEGDSAETLAAAGIELAPLPAGTVRSPAASFPIERAIAADALHPQVPANPHRAAYYVVQLSGPPLQTWLGTVQNFGVTIHKSLPGYALLVSALPADIDPLRELAWVEAVTPYRPTMKVSHHLRPGVEGMLTVAELATLEIDAVDPEQQETVQITLFPGESTTELAAAVRDAGGVVFEQTPHKIIALVSPVQIMQLAEKEGIEAILPFHFPSFNNDRARRIIGVPDDHVYDLMPLTGAGQIVGIADSGLDTGDPATVHPDLRGRVVAITSYPTHFPSAASQFINGPLVSDDGPGDPNTGHGTHVAGSVAGNASAACADGSPVTPRGTAPEARLFFQAIEQTVPWKTAADLLREGLPVPRNWPPPYYGLYGLPNDLGDLFGQAYSAGARIHTNSWGAPNAGIYNESSQAVDGFVWQHRDMLILFSAGNAGVDINGDGVIDDDSIGTPGTAKNCLTVGASENDRPPTSRPTPGLNKRWTEMRAPGDRARYPQLAAAGHVSDNPEGIAAFSSRGPTDDARIKPDVVAPGTNILSTRSRLVSPNPLWGDVTPDSDALSGNYCWSGGTSMSTPLVAGAAAVVRQYLTQQRRHVQPGVKPSAALLKAVLIGGARQPAGQFPNEVPDGPNSISGFGRIHLRDAITPTALACIMFTDEPDFALRTGEMRIFSIQVVDPQDTLKVTLVWTDAPSIVGTGGVVNALYLQLVAPDGRIFQGDVKPFPTTINNVQQVTVADPPVGTYQVRVRGVSVTENALGSRAELVPRQDFALVLTNALGCAPSPASIVQAIDTTSSMGVFGFMDPVKAHATHLLDMLAINDKTAVVEFSRRPGESSDTRAPFPLRTLGSERTEWQPARAAIAGLVAEGRTPLGAGLMEGWRQLLQDHGASPQTLLLVTDGLDSVLPNPADVLDTVPGNVATPIVALGPAAQTSLLVDLLTMRGSGAYFPLDADEDLHRLHAIWAQIAATATGRSLLVLQAAECAPHTSTRHTFAVVHDITELTVALTWDAADDVTPPALRLIDPTGVQRDGGTPAALVRRQGDMHLVRVALPEAGEWVAELVSGEYPPEKTTVAVTVRGGIRLSAETKVTGVHKVSIVARLAHGHRPWCEPGRVVARVTRPTRSQLSLWQAHDRDIRRSLLPGAIDATDLSPEQRRNLQLAVFAMAYRDVPGGLFERETIDVALAPLGDGSWVADVPLSAGGNVTVEVEASGLCHGRPWQRVCLHATRAPDVPEQDAPLVIDELFSRRNRTWGYTILGVRVTDASGAPIASGAPVTVTMRATGRTWSARSQPLRFYRRGGYFIWRLPSTEIQSASAEIEAQLTVDGVLVASKQARVTV